MKADRPAVNLGAKAVGEQNTPIGNSLDIWRAIAHQTFLEADVMFFFIVNRDYLPSQLVDQQKIVGAGRGTPRMKTNSIATVL